MPGKYKIDTHCVVEYDDQVSTKPHILPIYATSSFEMEGMDEAAEIFKGKNPGHVYGRYGNPTIDTTAKKIADLEGKTVYTDVDKTKLFQNNPNPFKGITTLTYFIDESTTVTNATIEVRELTGLLKSTILLSDKSGLGKIDFNSDGLNDGYYIYTLKVNGSVKDSKMLLVGE